MTSMNLWSQGQPDAEVVEEDVFLPPSEDRFPCRSGHDVGGDGFAPPATAQRPTTGGGAWQAEAISFEHRRVRDSARPVLSLNHKYALPPSERLGIWICWLILMSSLT